MVSEALEASPVGTKPPAAVDEFISMDGRHNSNAAAPHSTTLSSLRGRTGGSAFTPKLVELVVRPGSTRRVEKQSLRIACAAVAAPSMRSRVLVSACCPAASVARRGCRAPCSRRVSCWFHHIRKLIHLIRNFVQLLVPSFESFFHHSIYIHHLGLARPKFFFYGDGVIALGDCLALLP